MVLRRKELVIKWILLFKQITMKMKENIKIDKYVVLGSFQRAEKAVKHEDNDDAN